MTAHPGGPGQPPGPGQPAGTGAGAATPMSERMQALLSRAVEDQLSEQRQLAGALHEVRAAIARLPAEVAAAGGGAQPGSERLDAVAHGMEGLTQEVRAAVRLLGERVDGVHRLVQQRGEDLSALGARLDRLEHHLNAQATALDAIREGLEALATPAEGAPGVADDGHREALEQRLAGLDERLVDVTERIGGIEEGVRPLAEVTDEAVATRTTLAAIAADVADLRARSESAPAPAETPDIGEDLATLTEAVAALTEQVDTLVARAPAAPPAAAPEVDVEGVVRAATAESERRLTAHVDEAVLALAEALLRRRARGLPRATPASPDASPAGPVAAAGDVLGTEPFADEPAEPEPTGDAAQGAAAALAELAGDDDSVEQALQRVDPTEPVLPDVLPDAADGDPADAHGRKRRPWWRPAD